MFDLSIKGWSLDKDLQIIQADVLMAVGDSIIIEKPVCIDVGFLRFCIVPCMTQRRTVLPRRPMGSDAVLCMRLRRSRV